MALQSSQRAAEPVAGLMPFGETYHSQVRTRRRRGRAWALIFQAAMLSGIVALCALLLNIVNQSFGYVAIANENDPAELAVDGVPLNELPKENLVQILEANISSGLMRRYEHDKPFTERSRENVHELILERVVEPQVEATWGLFDSVFARGSIMKEADERFPGSEVYFRSWLRPVSSPSRSRASRCAPAYAPRYSAPCGLLSSPYCFPFRSG